MTTDSAPAVDGVTWRLQAVPGTKSLDPVPDTVVSTMAINDGRVQLATGCNTGMGDVTVTDTQLTWGSLALTRMFCPGLPGETETAVVAVIGQSQPTTWSVSDNTLTLTAANGKQLVYRAS